MTEAMKDRPGYRAALAQHEERERAATMAQERERKRIEGKLQAGADEAGERLGRRREGLRADWLRDGGTEEEFEREWPLIRADLLRGRTEEREQDFRLGQRNHYREVF